MNVCVSDSAASVSCRFQATCGRPGLCSCWLQFQSAVCHSTTAHGHVCGTALMAASAARLLAHILHPRAADVLSKPLGHSVFLIPINEIITCKRTTQTLTHVTHCYFNRIHTHTLHKTSMRKCLVSQSCEEHTQHMDTQQASSGTPDPGSAPRPSSIIGS